MSATPDTTSNDYIVTRDADGWATDITFLPSESFYEMFVTA